MRKLLSSKKFHTSLGFSISLVLLIVVFREVDWSEVADQFANANYWVLLPALAVILLHYILRSRRWRLLLPDDQSVPTKELFDAIVVGTLATYILPLRVGEFIRPYMLSLRSKHTFSVSFVSVVVERFFDLSMVLVTFAIVAGSLEELPDWGHQGAVLLSRLALCLFVVMITCIFFPTFVGRISEKLLPVVPAKFRPMAAHMTSEFLRGMALLGDRVRVAKIILYSVFVWLTCYLLFYVFLFFFNIPPSIEMAVVVSVVLALAVALPSAPGFLGVYQAGCLAAFALYNVNHDAAVAYSIMTHLFQYVFFVGYGTWILTRTHLSLTDLRDQKQAVVD